MKKLLILFLLSFFIVNSYSKSNTYEKVKSAFKNAKTITITFSNPAMNFKGTLSADKNGRYIISTPERIISSDQKCIRNYSKEEAKLIINPYEEPEDISIENIFFEFADNYILKSESQKTGISILRLKPQKKNDSYDELELWVKSNDLTIKKVVFISSSGDEVWDIISIKKNQKFTNETFDFKTPKNTKVIDLR